MFLTLLLMCSDRKEAVLGLCSVVDVFRPQGKFAQVCVSDVVVVGVF